MKEAVQDQSEDEREGDEVQSDPESLCDYFDHGLAFGANELLEGIFGGEVECRYLQGGAFNSVIKATYLKRDFILRFPKQELSVVQVYNIASISNFAGSRFDFVPRVIAVDATRNNPLRRQYWLQTCIPGQCLADVFATLNCDQRCSLAAQLAHVIADIHKVKFKHCGNLVAGRTHKRLVEVGTPHMVNNRFQSGAYAYSTVIKHQCKPTNLRDYFKTRFEALGACSGNPKWQFIWTIAERVLVKKDCAPSESTMVHPDLFKRNILVEILDERKVRISGIIDWDECEALPPALAYAMPAWLWSEEKEASSRQYTDAAALAKPGHQDSQRIRSAFKAAIKCRLPDYWSTVKLRDPRLQILGWLAREGEQYFGGNCPSYLLDAGNHLLEEYGFRKIAYQLLRQSQFVPPEPREPTTEEEELMQMIVERAQKHIELLFDEVVCLLVISNS